MIQTVQRDVAIIWYRGQLLTPAMIISMMPGSGLLLHTLMQSEAEIMPYMP